MRRFVLCNGKRGQAGGIANMTDPVTDPDLALLKAVPAFRHLNEAMLTRILAVATRQTLARGDTLLEEGAQADDLFIVLRGRFSVLSGDSPIAEISVGEPIGELAFFAGGRRTATVVAARDAEVLSLSRVQYDSLSKDVPELDKSILASVAERLARTTTASPKLRPRPGHVVVFLPVDGGDLPDGFSDGIVKAMAPHVEWRVRKLSAEPALSGGDAASLQARMSELEVTDRNLLLIYDVDAGAARSLVVGNADTVYLVGAQAETAADIPLSPVETQVFGATRAEHLHLALFRDRSDQPIAHAAAWLNTRDIALHHHVALDSPTDFDRLARFVTGRAVGLVLCGGGAFGTAHLGAIKALQEQGIAVDMVGGTSVGAAMAAALALEYGPDLVMDICEQIFVRSKAMSKLTVPLYSVIDHRRLDKELQAQFGDRQVEDAAINLFAVATSLTLNDQYVARRGPLWKIVRASSSIPAVFPPMLMADGHVLVDGALIDNVPIRVMRDLKPGPNLVLNFKQSKEWRVMSRYDDLPGRLGALQRILWRRRGQPRFPTIFSILTRAMIVSSRRQLDQTSFEGDILLEISTMKGMGFLDWTKGRQLFQKAYDQMRVALAEASVNASDPVEQLRLAAAAINAEGAEDGP